MYSTSNFLGATAHGCILFCLLFERNDYVIASLPPVEVVKLENKVYADMDTSLSIALSLSLVAIVLELFFFFYLTLSQQFTFYSLISHTLACMTLLKFAVDFHPVQHFWVAFTIFNCPPLVCQFYQLIIQHCCPVGAGKWKLC